MERSSWYPLLCLLVVSPWLLGGRGGRAGEQRLLVRPDGTVAAAKFVGARPGRTIVFRQNNQQQTLAWADFARWGAWQDTFRGTQIVLTDGSLIVAELVDIADETVTVDGDVCGRVQIPTGRLRGVLLDPPIDSLRRDRLWYRLFAANGTADQLLLHNGDTIDGALLGMRPTTDQRRVEAPAVVLVSDGRPLEVSLDRIVALIFNPLLTVTEQPPARRLLMGFRDGSLLNVARMDAEDPFARLTLTCSVKLDVDASFIRDELTHLLPFGPGTVYLSDLSPTASQQIPWLELEWPLRRDRSVSGGRLRSSGQIALKGLGMHSAASAAYRLDGGFRRFQAEVALDDRAGHQGSVVFRVFVYDASGARALAYESPVVRGNDSPLPVSVDVSGARALALVVDFSERGHVLDHANWLNARLIK